MMMWPVMPSRRGIPWVIIPWRRPIIIPGRIVIVRISVPAIIAAI
jgi:hypothetical protein